MTSTFFVLSSICCSTQTDLSPDFITCQWCGYEKKDEYDTNKEDNDELNKGDDDDANKEDRGLSKRATINSTFLPPKTTISCQEMSF